MGCNCGQRNYQPMTSHEIAALQAQNDSDGLESATIGPERDAMIAAAKAKKSDRRPSGR